MIQQKNSARAYRITPAIIEHRIPPMVIPMSRVSWSVLERKKKEAPIPQMITMTEANFRKDEAMRRAG
jgi:hypothetical protein